MAQDYYKTLGISKGASEKEIKTSYRKLAMKYHPDRTKGDKKAEAKFKEVNEAYAVLSDPKKRQQFDTYGAQDFNQRYSQEDIFKGADFSQIFRDMGFGGAPGGNGGDPFADLFGGGGRSGFGQARRGPTKGQDAQYDLTIGFDEAYRGSQRKIEFTLGDGSKHSLQVKIPAGISTGKKLRVKERGYASASGGPKGDLYILVKVGAHPDFTREGNHILVDVKVPLTTLLLGGSASVPTLEGPKSIKIKSLMNPGTKVRLSGMGFPNTASGKKGDLYAKILVDFPKTLTAEQSQLIEKMQGVGL